MKELIYRKLQLIYYFYKVIFGGIIKVLLNKCTCNDYLTSIESQKINNRLKLWKTIYFNLRTLPYKHAIKMPVWIYGKTKFYDLSGNIIPIVENKIKPSMFIIGHMDQVRSCDTITSITLKGNILFGNNVVLRQGAKMRIDGNLILEDNVYIGDNNTFIISKKCTIRKDTRVAYNCLFMDTDIHYVIDINSKMVKKNTIPIEIGKGNWIGGYTTIKKGTKTSDYTIVVGPFSCLTKDYTNVYPEYSCVGGCPVKLLRSGLRRINNNESERFLNTYFNNKENSIFILEKEIDCFCSPTINV